MSEEIGPATQPSAPSSLSDEARAFINASARPNTRRSYVTQLRQWIDWSEASGCNAFPADPIDVANYLAERGKRGQSPSTLRTVVAAIKAGHDTQGLAFDSKAPAVIRI